MYRKASDQRGFHIIELSIILLVIGILGFVGYRVYNNHNKGTSSSNSQSTSNNGEVVWAFDETKLEWFTKSGKAPSCKEPFHFDQTPIELSKVMSVGLPGAYRGFSYKPHGGFRLLETEGGTIDVKMPADATLVSLTRYYEGNPAELQYLLTFETDCGIAFRFDHLRVLSPEFQKIAETTPEPKKDDTRVDPNVKFDRKKFKSGDVVATEVGFAKTKNFGFDFGTYDYRSRNDISKNSKWASIHSNFQSSEWYGRCWIDQLPEKDVDQAKKLALIAVNTNRPDLISDYCSFAPHQTLDFNNGQPTDG